MFLWDWFCRKLGLTDLPSHDGKVTSDINFILGPYYRSFRADRDSLYEWLLHSRLLWKKAWNNEYQSEYESVSRISIWINFHPNLAAILIMFLSKQIIHWSTIDDGRNLTYGGRPVVNKHVPNSSQMVNLFEIL